MAVSTLPVSIPDLGRKTSVSAASNHPSVRVCFQEHALRTVGDAPAGAMAYWRGVLEHGSRVVAPNLDTQPGWIEFEDGGGCPVTVQDGPRGNSYPASLLTQYIDYPRAELDLVESAAARLATSIGLAGFEALLRLAQADRVVQWNSWLMSTNVPPQGLIRATQSVTAELLRRFPGHAILLKNVDPTESADWIPTLRHAGYDLVTSRQVYHFDGKTAAFWSKSTVKRDLKEFAADPRFTWCSHEEISVTEALRITQLYSELYLEKHSQLNPQYTERFVRSALRERWLEFHGLRDQGGTLVGVFGFFTLGGTTTVPFIGYDTSLPQEAGLYRRLFAGILRLIGDRKQHLNYSSGAGDFKVRRGGVPVIEFNALRYDHLPIHRRTAFRLAGVLVNRYVRPWLENHSH
jgi:hypothetical protein